MAELKNRMWTGGWTNPTMSIQKPDGWDLWYSEGEEMFDGQVTAAPELRILEKTDLPQDEWDDYVRIGPRTLKVFRAYNPMAMGLEQDVSGFEVGRTYRFSLVGFNDTHDGYVDGKKVPPNLNDPPGRRASRVTLRAQDVAEVTFDERSFPGYDGDNPKDWYLHRHTLTLEFVATAETMTLSFELYHAWGIPHNSWFVDAMELVAVEDEEEPEPGPYVYPVVERGSKLGVHAILANRVREFANRLHGEGTHFSVVKAVDDMGWIEDVKQIAPATITVGRFTSRFEGCGELDTPGADLDRMAGELIGVILDKRGETNVDYWEVSNEPDPPGPQGYERLGLLMIECMKLAEQHDLKLALFGLNAGTPEWSEMKAMAATGVFRRARQGGHILSLHEGTFDTHDPKKCYGDAIPGAPQVDGAGCLNFRYRYLYDILERRGEVIPLLISEWYCGDEASASTETLVEAARWYESEMAKDYYALGFCPFTLGPSQGWGHTDWERAYPGLCDYAISVKDRANGMPPAEPEDPLAYDRHYVLLPPIQDAYERFIYRSCFAAVTNDEWTTIGHSAQDAADDGPHARTRHVTAVNPGLWPSDLGAWFEENFPALDSYREIEGATPYEAAVHAVPPLSGDRHLAQSDERWSQWDFGEAKDGLIGTLGCYLTALTEIVGDLTGRDLTPPEMDALLRLAQAVFSEDNIVSLGAVVDLFPSLFTDHKKDNRTRSAGELDAMLSEGWAIILPKADYSHFVKLERVEGGELVIVDSYDGKVKRKAPSWAGGVRALLKVGHESSPTLGLHDLAGGRWLAERGVRGICIALAQVQTQPVELDFRDLDAQVIVRLNWGYADGSGTLPGPEHKEAFVSAVAETINQARGVWGFTLGNEFNNPAEWPGGYPEPDFVPSPAYYAEVYNAVCQQVDARMAPFAVDPYNVVAREFGQPGDPKDWARYDLYDRVDFVCLHAKTQTNDPSECYSSQQFTHAPLIGRFLHLRTIEDQLAWAPRVPVFVTELNPQRTGEGLGWQAGNAEWVRQAVSYLRTQPVDGFALYRYEDADAWGLRGKPQILEVLLALT